MTPAICGLRATKPATGVLGWQAKFGWAQCAGVSCALSASILPSALKEIPITLCEFTVMGNDIPAWEYACRSSLGIVVLTYASMARTS
ncbi:hypothetical protein [Cupriavidus necator]